MGALKHAKTFENVHFCVESSGIYPEEIVKFLQDKGLIVSVINPFQSKAFANSKLCRSKTDKVDVGLLAHYYLIYQPKAQVKPSEEVKTLRRLVRFFNTQIGVRAQNKTRLQSIKDEDVAHVLKGTRKYSTD